MKFQPAFLICALAAVVQADAATKSKATGSSSPTPTPVPAQATAATVPVSVPATRESKATVVVYNEKDADSQALAKYYAVKRSIPEENLVALQCSTDEEISRKEYDHDIVEPLRAIFEKKGWWKLREEANQFGRVESAKIHFVALMRGIPLKIAPEFSPYEGDNKEGPPQMVAHNEAAVDSELAALGVYTRRISGGLINPYYRSYQRFSDSGLNSLLLVCRLDGPTPAIVRRMIDDAVATEQRGLEGIAYLDARGTQDPSLVEGDRWLLNAATGIRRRGIPVILDTGAGLYPQGYPMNHAALYLGWYTEHVSGPFVRPDFRFAPGAVAVHLHSFSAVTVRDAKRQWCGPLLAAGAAATAGNVYEPYLAFTPNLDVLADRLCAGFTFAESSYMSERVVSWMTTFVGDPLYRPYKAAELGWPDPPRDEWEAYRAGAQVWFERGPDAGTAELQKLGKQYSSGAIFEGLGLLQLSVDRTAQAAATFEDAAKAYQDPADILRATIHEVFQLRALKRASDAVALAKKRVGKYPKAAGADVLQAIQTDMAESLGKGR